MKRSSIENTLRDKNGGAVRLTPSAKLSDYLEKYLSDDSERRSPQSGQRTGISVPLPSRLSQALRQWAGQILL
jgi:hypothetical protein